MKECDHTVGGTKALHGAATNGNNRQFLAYFLILIDRPEHVLACLQVAWYRILTPLVNLAAA